MRRVGWCVRVVALTAASRSKFTTCFRVATATHSRHSVQSSYAPYPVQSTQCDSFVTCPARCSTSRVPFRRSRAFAAPPKPLGPATRRIGRPRAVRFALRLRRILRRWGRQRRRFRGRLLGGNALLIICVNFCNGRANGCNLDHSRAHYPSDARWRIATTLISQEYDSRSRTFRRPPWPPCRCTACRPGARLPARPRPASRPR